MKKVFMFVAVAAMVMVVASCGNKKNAAEAVEAEEVVEEVVEEVCDSTACAADSVAVEVVEEAAEAIAE